MDKKNLVIFLALSLAVMGFWYYAVVKPQERAARMRALKQRQDPQLERDAKPAPADEKKPGQEAAPKKETGDEQPAITEPKDEKPIAGEPEKPEEKPGPKKIRPVPAQDLPIETFILKNDLIEAAWSNRGAGLVSAKLLRYKAAYEIDGERPVLTLLREMQPGLYSFVIESVNIVGPAAPNAEEGAPEKPGAIEYDLTDVVYKVSEFGDDGTGKLVFDYALPNGLLVRKTVSLSNGNYHFDTDLEFINKSGKPLTVTYNLRTAAGIEPEQLPRNSVTAVIGIREGEDDYAVIKKPAAKLAGKPYESIAGGLHWAGMNNRYFVVVALAKDDSQVSEVLATMLVDDDLAQAKGRWAPGMIRKKLDNAESRKALARSNAAASIKSTKIKLTPGDAQTHTYQFILAPKLTDVLTSYNCRLRDLQEFTWFKGISRVLVKLLTGVYYVVPNYGLAILILTFLVKLALHPLTKKSQVSLVRMQQLQPELQKLKDKYGHDKQRLGAEQWGLYKKFGINPMSGCWPMFFQMPVFIALFGALRGAFPLRQAAFLWIADLSQPDTVARLPFDIPLMNTDMVNVLPFVMLISGLVSQKLQPKATDPQARQQQQMMLFMSVFFAFILYKMPSGLLLYWTTSTIMGIFEQWLIRRKVEKIKAAPLSSKADRKKKIKKGPKIVKQGKGGLLNKLQNMIDDQAQAARTASSKKNRRGGKGRR